MSWTQSICRRCFVRRYPDRAPVRLKEPQLEQCCDCGVETRDGIYIRDDPRTVAYPRVHE